MGEPQQVFALLPDYDAMVAAIVARTAELGMTYGQLDEVAGLPLGYAAKALGPSQTRKFGWLTIFLMAPELGLGVALLHDEKALQNRRIPAHKGNPNQSRPGHYASPVSMRVLSRAQRVFSKNGNRKRWKRTTKKQRKGHGRLMALKRWHPDAIFNWDDIKSGVVPPELEAVRREQSKSMLPRERQQKPRREAPSPSRAKRRVSLNNTHT